MARHIKNLSNKKYNKLIVLELDKEKTKNKKAAYWICQCECGNKITVRSDNLISGRVQSCGCIQKEISSKVHSKSNRIEFDTNLGCLRVYFNNCDEYFLCDVEDRDIAEKYTWHKDKIHGYAVCNINNSNEHITIKFHRLVMEKYYGDLSDYNIDHINHNKIDNRKFNLRKCTQSQNRLNSRTKTNTGFKNISYYNNYYHVKINNKDIGYYTTLDEAVSFRDNYIKDNPNDFYYDPNEDYINRNNPNAIHPFKFINPDNIIQPFKTIN